MSLSSQARPRSRAQARPDLYFKYFCANFFSPNDSDVCTEWSFITFYGPASEKSNLTATKDEVNSLRTRTQHPTVQAPPAARLTSSPSLIVAHSIPVEHRKPKIESTVRPRKTFEMDCEQSKIRGVSGGEMSASVREGAHCWQPR